MRMQIEYADLSEVLFQVHTSTKTSSHERKGLEKWNKKEWIMQAAKNRKTSCSSFTKQNVSLLLLLTQNEM